MTSWLGVEILAQNRTKTAARTLVEVGLIGAIDPTAGAITSVQRIVAALGKTSPPTAARFEAQIKALQRKLKEIAPNEAAVDGARAVIAGRMDDLRLLLRVDEDAEKAAREVLRQRAARLPKGYSDKDRAQIVLVLRAYFLCLKEDEGLGEAIQREIQDNQARLLQEVADLKGLIQWIAASDADRALESGELRLGITRDTASDYLNARYQVAPFVGRADLLQELSDWGDAPEQLLVRLFHAAGGQGKTRLALEAARQARQAGWRAGFLRGEATVGAIDALCESGRHLFVILDYTEGRGALIRTFLSAARRAAQADPRRTIRFLILARNADYWWTQQIQEGETIAPLLAGADVAPLPLAAEDEVARQSLFDQALVAYRAVLPAAWVKENAQAAAPDLSGERYGSALLLNIVAMAVARGDPAPAPDDCLDYALRRDEEYWTRRLASEGGPVDVETLRVLIALATLLAGAAPAGAGVDAAQLLARARATTDLLPETLHAPTLASLLIDLYPATGDDAIDALRPDPVGEWLVGGVLGGRTRGRDALLALLADETWSDDQRQSAAVVLIRSALLRPESKALIDALATFVSADPKRHAAFLLEGALKTDVRPLEALQDAKRLPLNAMMALANALPPYDLRLLKLRAALHQDIVATLRKTAEEREGDDSQIAGNLAAGLNNSSVALAEIGAREEALAAIEEAVALRRDLAAARPEAFTPDLARSLSVLGDRLSELERWGGGRWSGIARRWRPCCPRFLRCRRPLPKRLRPMSAITSPPAKRRMSRWMRLCWGRLRRRCSGFPPSARAARGLPPRRLRVGRVRVWCWALRSPGQARG
jgi:hypothetical protein